jgi:hypothetical protein
MSISTADIGPWSWAEVLWAWGNLQNQRIAVNFCVVVKTRLATRRHQKRQEASRRRKTAVDRHEKKQASDSGSINTQPRHVRRVKRFKVVKNIDLGERKVVRRRIYRRVEAGQKQAPT